MLADLKYALRLLMALGAQRSDMLRLILSQSLAVIGIGLIVGLISSLFVTRLMSTLLYGVSANDLSPYASVLLLLGCAAVFAIHPRASGNECRSNRCATI
jgi:ABC-type antimicrobial peptide transport system permease subunit